MCLVILWKETLFDFPNELIISDLVKKYNYPICFNFPLGHSSVNNPVIVGSEVELFVDQKYSKIHYR